LALPLAAIAFSSMAKADGLPFTLSPYNAFIFGNFAGSVDYGGGIAAGGTLTLTNTSVANALLGEASTLFPADYTLVAGGNLITGSGTLASGNAYGGGASDNFNLTLTSGVFTKAPAADPVNFATSAASFKSLSTTLSKMGATAGDSCVYDGFATTTCTATGAGLNVINVSDPTILGTGRTVNIKVAAGASLVINLAGVGTSSAPVYLSNFGINVNGSGVNGDSTTAAAHNVLFNYYQATNLDLYSVVGSVLAPNASIIGGNGQIDGNLVAASYSGAEEFHNFGYEGPLPSASAPEPMTLVLIGSGLLCIGLIRRKKPAK
jgi:choice-of-anchor A domain-containing protein